MTTQTREGEEEWPTTTMRQRQEMSMSSLREGNEIRERERQMTPMTTTRDGVREDMQTTRLRERKEMETTRDGVREDMQTTRLRERKEMEMTRDGVREDMQTTRYGVREDMQTTRLRERKEMETTRDGVRDDMQTTRLRERKQTETTREGVREDMQMTRYGVREDMQTTRLRERKEMQTTPMTTTGEREDMQTTRLMEGKETQMTRTKEKEDLPMVKKTRTRKRKRRLKENEELNDVGGDIPLVQDKALTGCLPMGCHCCKKFGGLSHGDKDDDTGNAQLCQSFRNDGRRRLSESSLCFLDAPPIPHLDVCGISKNVSDAIDNVSDKTTAEDNALTGCLADGCRCHRSCFFPTVELGNGRSNAQLCVSSVDDHRRRLLGYNHCETVVEETGLISVQNALDRHETSFQQVDINFSIGSAFNGTPKPSRYQWLNRKRRDCKRREGMIAKNDKIEQQGHATSVKNPATRAGMQPKLLRQNRRHQDARAQEISMFQGEVAKHENSTIVHLLSQQELDAMKDKGAIVVHVTSPVKTHEGKVKLVFWEIQYVSTSEDIFGVPCKKNLLILTTYDQISSSKRIRFIGTASHKPNPKTWALLCLVHHQTETKSSFDENFFDVIETKKNCGLAKYNIVTGKSTGHHRSRGFIFGFGSRRDMRIDNISQSSLAQYSIKKGGDEKNTILQEQLKNSMGCVRDKLKRYVGHDILLDNSNSLSVSERYAKKLGISRDFHLLGRSAYTSLFYNVNASTLDRHTEMDWTMTTIYVPHQEWVKKSDDHLQFLFHLMDWKNGIIKISMRPGTIIYFHGSLLTHQQLHDHGKHKKQGCCLNFSAYANRKLLCHYISSINRAKRRKICHITTK